VGAQKSKHGLFFMPGWVMGKSGSPGIYTKKETMRFLLFPTDFESQIVKSSGCSKGRLHKFFMCPNDTRKLRGMSMWM